MRTSYAATAFAMAGGLLCGCAHGAGKATLAESEVSALLAGEEIAEVRNVEQLPQEDGSVTLLVTGKLRATGFGGCAATRSDLDIERSEGRWVVKSMSEHERLSLAPCSKAGDAVFANLSGNYSDSEFSAAVGHLRRLVAGSIEPRLISGSAELKDALIDLRLDDLTAILTRTPGVEFQFLSKRISPRLLGVRIVLDDGRLKHVQLVDGDSLEVIAVPR